MGGLVCIARRKLPLLVVLLAVIGVFLSLHARVDAEQCGPKAHGQKCGGGNCCSNYGFCGKSKQYCAKGNCQKAYGKCSDSCFPGSAMVLMRDGIKKPISEVALGEQIAVWNEKGEVEYDDVYAHGHLEAEAWSEFIALRLTNLKNKNVTKTLELTPHHFTVVATGINSIHYKRAKDVKVGDHMLAINEHQSVASFVISDIKKQNLMGLYNPYTIKGSIVVNDVVTSCHSEWFLDSIFDSLNLPHWLPTAYQAILTPIRSLYKMMGKDAYKALYERLDSQVDVANTCKDVRGYLKLLTMALSPSSSIGGVDKDK